MPSKGLGDAVFHSLKHVDNSDNSVLIWFFGSLDPVYDGFAFGPN
jgi:hypothetical protein